MGSRKTGDGVENVYAAAATWVERALKADDSLFTPGEPIWSSRWLGELRKRFLDNPDEGKRSFYEKLQEQLLGSPPEVFQLMAEVLYAQFLIVWKGGMGGGTKKNQVEQVLGWGAPVSTIPEGLGLVEGLTPGIALSQAFTQHRPYQVAFIIESVEQWKELDADERERLLKDPWAFKEFATHISFKSLLLRDHPNAPGAQREAVLHLVHPGTFEGTVSVQQKRDIAGATAFAHFLTEDTPDVDRRLVQIRRGLEIELGGDFDFYDRGFNGVDVHSRWDPHIDPWDEFVRRAQEYVDAGRLESEEIEGKVRIGQRLAAAREAVLAGAEGWATLVKRGISGNLVFSIGQAKLRGWIDESPDDALTALQAIWTEDNSPVSKRVGNFCSLLPRSASSGLGSRTAVSSVLLMGVDPEQFPPFRVSVFNPAYQLTQYDRPEEGTDEASSYECALGFLDRFIQEASERGLELRHRLDAQSVVWAIHRGRGGTPDVDEVPEPDLNGLAAETYLPAPFLENIERLLKDKKQVIFQGPPGTGKTYVAQKLAKHLADSEERVTLVQLHPSYAYEDFVQGFRPTLKDGHAGFELMDGPLLRAARRAQAEPEERHFLVIDEINRGNVAKVFGELYFLLEYRGEKIRLQYQRENDESFSLPDNLYVIGTMNTADRSIALVDLALRRRFYFVDFRPDEDPVKAVLRSWLREKTPHMMWVADVVERANEKLSDDRHAAIGPSYFMKEDLDDETVALIWRHSVLPYIEERLFGEADRVSEFHLEELRGPGSQAIKDNDSELQEGSSTEREHDVANEGDG